MPLIDQKFGNPYWGDNVPPDVPPPRDVAVLHVCPSCGNEWEVIMDYELGGYFYYNEEEKYCKNCGTEGNAL